MNAPAVESRPSGFKDWHLFIPKLVTVLREGYGARDLRADVFAGITVAIVALPLSMALAIASGVGPERGLFTAIVAGFFISALGGSRHQIGGPTGAFVVVVFNVVQQFGYDGLVVATLMAGVMLIAAGFLRLGTYIKYVPFPVVTGFTSGIAVIIFSSQVGDILGLKLGHVPGDVFGKWQAYFSALGSFSIAALAVALGSLAIIILLRRYAPKWPAFLIAIAAGSLAASALHLDIATIGTRFGGLPNMLPAPHWPMFNLAELQKLLPSAFTIFVLGGIESLLSAVVADGMTGRRHRSNLELVAQGAANIASASMGGIPATGAIARTATNIRSGARSPIAGIVHSLTVLVLMAAFAPYASYIPLAALGAVLVMVCWNMAEIGAFRIILAGPVGDRLVLLATFFLTVFVDLSVAIAVGMVMAAFMFMHRMAKVVESETDVPLLQEDVDDFASPNTAALHREELPDGVEVFQLNGPFFFGAAAHFEQTLSRAGGRPKILILNMAGVPLIDITGAATLRKFLDSTLARGTRVILAGVKEGPASVLDGMKVVARRAANFTQAVDMSREMLAA
ncbi:MAG TPA: SulP family inorganic anion transporter [Rhizomicrobium sp.]|nr:SulP family inorganic anion transporter [Rhizomicrobium sp.]